jgi:RNA polymerase sigma-70 factor (ECF subfamily)
MLGDEDLGRTARLRSLVDKYWRMVWRSLRRLGVPASAADDGVQQVFIIVARRLDEIESEGERKYLLGIALKVASDARRTIRRRRELPLDAELLEISRTLPIQGQPDEVIDRKRRLELLATCLDEMPDKLREAFVLFDLEELNASEVAEALQVPIGTVASRVRLARARIRKSLTSMGIR